MKQKKRVQSRNRKVQEHRINLRSNIWCRNVFQYRYDQFLMYASCKRCIDQFGCRSIYPAGNVYGI